MQLSKNIIRLPKAELHVHLEFTASPQLVKKLAQRHGMDLPDHIFSSPHHFSFKDFLDFLKLHDFTSQVIKTPEDYRDITYEYLAQCAKEGTLYVELMCSPDHAAIVGMSYEDQVLGIAQGITDAQKEFGIQARIIITGVRHFGVEKVEAVARMTQKFPHEFVVGFSIAGDEAGYPPAQFAKAFLLAEEAGLLCAAHAGEMCGPESIRETLQHLPIKRLGHGVRIIEDPALMKEVKELDIALEVCPTSNIVLKVYPDYATHPLVKLKEAGLLITLNSDDPPYFGTTIGYEYEIAQKHFGFTDADLIEVTKTSIATSFADPDTKLYLLNKVDELTAA